MSHLVRVRVGNREFNVGAAYATAHGLTVLDEPTHAHGRPRRASRAQGRPVKPKVSVADAIEKKAAQSADQSDTAPSSKES